MGIAVRGHRSYGEGLGKKFEGSVSTGGQVVNGWLHFFILRGLQ